MSADTPFPEVQSGTDPRVVPWHMAVVWSEGTLDGKRVYQWLSKEHIRLVSWAQGSVSIQILDESPIGRDVMYFIISAPFIAVGKNIPV